MKGDVDLVKIEATEFPIRLGRALRNEIFGQNRLVEKMIGVEHSTKKEAEGSDVNCFLVRCFVSNNYNSHQGFANVFLFFKYNICFLKI